MSFLEYFPMSFHDFLGRVALGQGKPGCFWQALVGFSIAGNRSDCADFLLVSRDFLVCFPGGFLARDKLRQRSKEI